MRAALSVLLLFVTLTSACGWLKHKPTEANGDEEEEEVRTEIGCGPLIASPAPRTLIQVLPPIPAQPRTKSLHRRSRPEIAEVIGVDDLLDEIQALQDESATSAAHVRFRLLEIRQELSERLLSAFFEVSSVAAELECETARAEELAIRLEETQNDIQQRRTVIALLADAIAGLISGGFLFVGTESLAGGADIIGNILQGTFGYAALGGQQKHEMQQARNLLEELWKGTDEPTLFPATVWRFLNWPLNKDSPRSRREAILLDWKRRLGPVGSKAERRRVDLFFGSGGEYTIRELRHRAGMLDQLKASVRLMSQDLNLLFQESLGQVTGLHRTLQTPQVYLDGLVSGAGVAGQR